MRSCDLKNRFAMAFKSGVRMSHGIESNILYFNNRTKQEALAKLVGGFLF